MTIENALTITNKPYMNADLQKVTNNIRAFDMNVRNNQFAIAYHMAIVDAKELYKDDGLESAIAWAQDAFGMQKTLAYNLIKLGKEYVREYRNAKGRVIGYGSNIVDPVPNGTINPDMPPIDFTANQLARLATLGRDTVVEAYKNGNIKPTSTAKEIQEFIKLHKALNAKAPEQEQPEQPEQEQPEQLEQATPEQPEKAPVQMFTCDPRPEMFDNISTAFLIAELRARGCVVMMNGKEQAIDWKTVEGA